MGFSQLFCFALLYYTALQLLHGMTCMYRCLCTVCVQYHDVVLHLTEEGCSLEAVGQEIGETCEAVIHPAIDRSQGIQ